MKNPLFIISFLMMCIFVNAQHQSQIDTIYVNNQKNVALFFPKPIRQGITGSSNFVFTYNREKAQYFGLLQASPGKESNLLAITNDGHVYAYILKYKNRLSKLNYFIGKKEDSVIIGIWRDDSYFKDYYPTPYKVVHTSGVSRYTVRRVADGS